MTGEKEHKEVEVKTANDDNLDMCEMDFDLDINVKQTRHESDKQGLFDSVDSFKKEITDGKKFID